MGLKRTSIRSLHPEGMSAISRGLSEATPPEEIRSNELHPEGMPARFDLADIGDLPASLQDAKLSFRTRHRGCRGRSTPG